MTRQMVRIAELEDRLSSIIATWLQDDPRFAGSDDVERLEQARIILGIGLSTVRVSMRAWAGHNPADPAAPAAQADPRKTYEHAIAVLKTVMEKLS